MLRHVILWQLKDELTEAEKQRVKCDIKQGLEGLNGKISGLESLEVHINGLTTSTADVMLDAWVAKESFADYAANPEHKKVAVEKIRPFVKSKMILDYPEN